MNGISESMKQFEANEKTQKKLAEAKKNEEGENVEGAIKALVDAKPSKDNAEQGKFVSLMKGLAFSDDPKATDFMAKVMKEIDGDMIAEGKTNEGVTGAEVDKLMKKANVSELLDMFADALSGDGKYGKEASKMLYDLSSKLSQMDY